MSEEFKKEEPLEQKETLFNPEKATDIEIVNFYCFHIDNPCEVEVVPGDIRNIRSFYIREARRILDEQGEKNSQTCLLGRY